MKKQEFQVLLGKAEVYANMYVENRVFLFSIDKQDDSYPAGFDDEWDTSNADVMIYDSMAEFMKDQHSEFQTAFDCFCMKYLNADLYHNGKEYFGTTQSRSFTTPAEDGLITLDQEFELRSTMLDAFQDAIVKSEWARGECFQDAFNRRTFEADAINDLLK